MDSSLCALDSTPDNCKPSGTKSFQSKLNRGAKFKRVQIMHGDFVTAFQNPSRYEKTNHLVVLVTQTGAE